MTKIKEEAVSAIINTEDIKSVDLYWSSSKNFESQKDFGSQKQNKILEDREKFKARQYEIYADGVQLNEPINYNLVKDMMEVEDLRKTTGSNPTEAK